VNGCEASLGWPDVVLVIAGLVFFCALPWLINRWSKL
jgi:hypothetical protein